jgi:hypothetical protein
MRILPAIAAGVIAAGLITATVADATDVNVSVTSRCEDTTWVVLASAKNTFDQVLHVGFDNSVEVAGFTLQPAQSLTTRILVPAGDQSFHYMWSTPDAILHGTLDATLARPAGCHPVATTTTVPAATSTTIPPETSTVPAPPTTPVPLPAPPVSPAPDVPPAPVVVRPRPAAPPASTPKIALPATE